MDVNSPLHRQLSVQPTLVYGETAMEQAGADFARCLIDTGKLGGAFIALSGELGSGKTTFCRGFISECGHLGSVKSPTYTLLEHYSLEHRQIYHLDLYRLADPDELEFIGFRELPGDHTTLLVEWIERVPALQDMVTSHVNLAHNDADSRMLSVQTGSVLERA